MESCRALHRRYEEGYARRVRQGGSNVAGNRRAASTEPLSDSPLPTPEQLDELDPDEAIRRIETVVENNTQLCFAVDGDTRSWGEMAVARVMARAKARPKTTKSKTVA